MGMGVLKGSVPTAKLVEKEQPRDTPATTKILPTKIHAVSVPRMCLLSYSC